MVVKAHHRDVLRDPQPRPADRPAHAQGDVVALAEDPVRPRIQQQEFRHPLAAALDIPVAGHHHPQVHRQPRVDQGPLVAGHPLGHGDGVDGPADHGDPLLFQGDQLLHRDIGALLVVGVHAGGPVVGIAVGVDRGERRHRHDPGHVPGVLGDVDRAGHAAVQAAERVLHLLPHPFPGRIVIVVPVEQVQVVQDRAETGGFRLPAHALSDLAAEGDVQALREDGHGPPLGREPEAAEVVSHLRRLVDDRPAVGLAYPPLAGESVGHRRRGHVQGPRDIVDRNHHHITGFIIPSVVPLFKRFSYFCLSF